MNRINFIKNYIKDSEDLHYPRTSGLNGEWLMRYVCDVHSLQPVCIPLFTRRYRATGSYSQESLTLRPKFLLREWPSFIGYYEYLKRKFRKFFNLD